MDDCSGEPEVREDLRKSGDRERERDLAKLARDQESRHDDRESELKSLCAEAGCAHPDTPAPGALGKRHPLR